MQGLQRRPSGVWVARLVVPARLRAAVGRVEFIRSTSTSNLAVAKVVGGELLAQWRRRLLHFDQMENYEELLRLVDGDPILQIGGHLPLRQAAEGAGLDSSVLLRQAAAAKADLFVRCHGEPGFVVSLRSLRTAMAGRRLRDGEEDDALDHGPLVVPGPNQMPADAMPHEASGVFRICAEDVPGIATAMLAGKPAQIIAFDWSGPEVLFIPNSTVVRTPDDIEVVAADVDALRRRLAAGVDPARLEGARALRLASVQGRAGKTSKSGRRRLSEALETYTRDFLPQHIRKPAEIERVRVGISLLIEFMGDVALDEVDAEFLRTFRNGPLAVEFHAILTRHFHPILTHPLCEPGGSRCG